MHKTLQALRTLIEMGAFYNLRNNKKSMVVYYNIFTRFYVRSSWLEDEIITAGVPCIVYLIVILLRADALLMLYWLLLIFLTL
jgi:hypothetical protein